MSPDVSGETLKRNDIAWNGVLLQYLVGKKVRAEKHASKRCSPPLLSQGIIQRNFYLREHCFLFTKMLARTQPVSSYSSWKKGEWVQIEHQPYSPDFFLFPRLKFISI
ncbi:hypothetical protein TNCV_1444021 [Trichonephila clavipes]|nr:hypothetical protein TNCV_1444021 [Trichonephila clavipes]